MCLTVDLCAGGWGEAAASSPSMHESMWNAPEFSSSVFAGCVFLLMHGGKKNVCVCVSLFLYMWESH